MSDERHHTRPARQDHGTDGEPHGDEGGSGGSADGNGPVRRSWFNTTDVEEATAVLQSTYVDYQPRFSRPRSETGAAFPALTMSGQSLTTPLGTLALDRVQVGIGMSIHCEPFPRLTVAWPLTGSYEFVHGREQAGGLRLAPSWQRFDSWWDDGVEVVVHSLDLDTVQRIGAELCDLAPAAIRFPSMHPLDPARERHLRATLGHLNRHVLTNPDALASPLVAAATMRHLATTVLATFPNTALDAVADPGRAGPGRTEPATVRRALEFIDTHADRPIGLGEIADAAGVGARGLQAAFRRHRDTTPLGHLRRVRLERAHQDLLRADPYRGDTVGGIAARWGFTHAGRFSIDYRARFGASPRHTLYR